MLPGRPEPSRSGLAIWASQSPSGYPKNAEAITIAKPKLRRLTAKTFIAISANIIPTAHLLAECHALVRATCALRAYRAFE